jgi:hypothetical protein
MIGNTAIEAVIGAPSRWLAAVNSQTGHRRGRSGICLTKTGLIFCKIPKVFCGAG